MGKEPNHTTAKCLVLYTTINTLWCVMYIGSVSKQSLNEYLKVSKKYDLQNLLCSKAYIVLTPV
jgi:hypothetical protein